MQILNLNSSHKSTESEKQWKKKNPELIERFKKLQKISASRPSRLLKFSILDALLEFVPPGQEKFLMAQLESLEKISHAYHKEHHIKEHKLRGIIKKSKHHIENQRRSYSSRFVPADIDHLLDVLENGYADIPEPQTLPEYYASHRATHVEQCAAHN